MGEEFWLHPLQDADALRVRPGPVPVDPLNMGIGIAKCGEVLLGEILRDLTDDFPAISSADGLMEVQAIDTLCQLPVTSPYTRP